MTDLLSASGLCLLRGDRCLFRDLAFALNPGEMLLVEGPNGSGKTSLLRGVAGLLDFETGAVSWDGRPVAAAYQEFRAELVWFSHRIGLKGDLNLLENLQLESALRPTRGAEMSEILARLGIDRLTGLPLKVLSAGQQRRCALARMLLSAGRLWIMDEPFTNLDRAGRRLVAEVIAQHVEHGGLCIAASHQDIEIDAPVRRISLQ